MDSPGTGAETQQDEHINRETALEVGLRAAEKGL